MLVCSCWRSKCTFPKDWLHASFHGNLFPQPSGYSAGSSQALDAFSIFKCPVDLARPQESRTWNLVIWPPRCLLGVTRRIRSGFFIVNEAPLVIASCSRVNAAVYVHREAGQLSSSFLTSEEAHFDSCILQATYRKIERIKRYGLDDFDCFSSLNRIAFSRTPFRKNFCVLYINFFT